MNEKGRNRFDEVQAPGIKSGLKDFPKHLNSQTITTGTIAAIFGMTGPAMIIIGAAEAGGLTMEQTVSWLFAVYFVGGIFSILLALHYKMPINGAYSIPGAILMASALTLFSLNEAAGAYLMAGILVLILGVTKSIGKIMKFIPLPIILAMIAGSMFRFALGIVDSVEQLPIVVGLTVVTFFVLYGIRAKFPPILGALIVGMAVAFGMGLFQTQSVEIGLALPALVVPVFTLDAFFSISIPLAILVIGAENAQATGALLAQKYKPPVNFMTTLSGIGGILTSFFGGHNANIAGPMTALCASESAGKKEGRYAATIVDGVLFASFGLFAGIAVPILLGLPGALISAVAGLAMIAVLINALQGAFSEKRFQVGAFCALAIGLSGITLFQISAPFWALVVGVTVSFIVERNDFKSLMKVVTVNSELPEEKEVVNS
ncbi:benzoate/H(+) symporter BenE family transporter [Alkalihalobacillus oceani]|uniref:benzoate/H(+) symporter BenE family transporter n=1 Tax=Halalkalibacter oceani TaxID=1653776 RepID=UPI00203F2ED1|nr:benzoate/H(+) symporter BenE family transporter [Halalkalibacter oceani]MCM3762859.1 benzoate/H(+) symporter BenE family transporter [Halalkalibacter oceani]